MGHSDGTGAWRVMSAIAGMSQRGRVMSLYKQVLVTHRNWCNNRELFCQKATETKAIFTPRLGETSPLVAEGYIQEGLDWLTKYRRPDKFWRVQVHAQLPAAAQCVLTRAGTRKERAP